MRYFRDLPRKKKSSLFPSQRNLPTFNLPFVEGKKKVIGKYVHQLRPRKEHSLNIVRFVCVLSREILQDRSKKNRYIRGYDEKRSSFLDRRRFRLLPSSVPPPPPPTAPSWRNRWMESFGVSSSRSAFTNKISIDSTTWSACTFYVTSLEKLTKRLRTWADLMAVVYVAARIRASGSSVSPLKGATRRSLRHLATGCLLLPHTWPGCFFSPSPVSLLPLDPPSSFPRRFVLFLFVYIESSNPPFLLFSSSLFENSRGIRNADTPRISSRNPSPSRLQPASKIRRVTRMT